MKDKPQMILQRKAGRLLVIFVLLYGTVGAVVARAEVSVGPSATEILLRSGEKGEVVFEIANTWDYDVQVKVDAVNWMVRTRYEKGSEDDVYEWLDFGEYREFVVPKKSLSKLTCDLRAPADFKGERIAQVFFEYSPANPTVEQAEIAKAVGQRIGLLLCLGAKGGEKLDASMKIENVEVKLNEDETSDVNVTYTIKNKGNIHARPRGAVIIKRGDRAVIEESVGPIQGLYAGESRTYQTPVKGLVLAPGKYRAEVRLKAISYDIEKNLESSKKFSAKK